MTDRVLAELSDDEIVKLKELHIDPSGLNMTLEGPGAASFSRMIGEFFAENGGTNFVIQTGYVPKIGAAFEVTVRRVDRPTPATLMFAYRDVLTKLADEGNAEAKEVLARFAEKADALAEVVRGGE